MRATDLFFPAVFLGYQDGGARVLDAHGQEWLVDRWQVFPREQVTPLTQADPYPPTRNQHSFKVGDRVKYVGVFPPNGLGLSNMRVLRVLGAQVEAKNSKWTETRFFDIDDIALI